MPRMAPTSGNALRQVHGPGAVGRPADTAKFRVARTAGAAGFSFRNAEPGVLEKVNADFLQRFEMPPNLQPRSRVLQNRTNLNISKGRGAQITPGGK